MQLRRTILRGAMVGGLLTMAGLVAPAPTTQAAGGDYGSCCTIIVNITPPSVTPPTVNPPVVNPPQITQTTSIVPVGGGGRSSVSTGIPGSMSSVSPVSSSVSPVSISARPSIAAPVPPAPAPAPVSQVLGRTVEAPELPAVVVPRPLIEETAPRVVAPPEEIAETAPRTVQREVCIPGVGGAGMGPNCGEVLGRTVQGPGLVMARVLPKAGEGQSTGFAIWPPLALAGAAAVLALVALALPRRRPRVQLA